MAIKCKCIKEYGYDYRTSNVSPWYQEVQFYKDNDYLFYNKGSEYYVCIDLVNGVKYLKNISRYNVFIEEMPKELFDQHFICDKIMNTKEPVYVVSKEKQKWVDIYNSIVENLVIYEPNIFLGDMVSELDILKLRQAEKMLGYVTPIIFFYENLPLNHVKKDIDHDEKIYTKEDKKNLRIKLKKYRE
jgi:hypothetical protein